ncbi:MAG: hypothetical protein MJZ33_09795 [Paludibacteraceae bacterium]|nr:hypothetical protein [Paludibacteraceae bacterium]
MSKTISHKALMYYIEREEIAFQFPDELIVFTHPKNISEIDVLDKASISEMKKCVLESNSIKIASVSDIISNRDDKGFNQLAQWSTHDDLLILVDDSLLLCLPRTVLPFIS